MYGVRAVVESPVWDNKLLQCGYVPVPPSRLESSVTVVPLQVDSTRLSVGESSHRRPCAGLGSVWLSHSAPSAPHQYIARQWSPHELTNLRATPSTCSSAEHLNHASSVTSDK